MSAEPGRLDTDGAPDPQSSPEPGSPAVRDASLGPPEAIEPPEASEPSEPSEPSGGAEPADDERSPEDEGGQSASSPKKNAKRRPFWRELAIIVVAALVLTILLKAFVVQVFSIPSGSMENTLMVGDRVLVNKLVYHFRPIARGDVIVFSGQGSWDPPAPPASRDPIVRAWDGLTDLVGISAPGTDYIKRVIGLPGDHVVCCDAQGRVTVNGVPLNEQSYIHPGDAPSEQRFNVTVPAARLWVMGDNRSDSDDSRYRQTDPGSGTIPESAVVGRAFVIIWPTSRIGDLPIPGTFQQAALHATAAAVSSAPAVGTTTAALAAGALAWRRRRRD
jgi:signal peptidase I